MSILLIKHDLGVVAENADVVAVMYGGLVVEKGSTATIFNTLAHPYTQGLFGARPGLSTNRAERLATIPGSVPDLTELPAGCPFQSRCPLAIEACGLEVPAPVAVTAGHEARCIRLDAALARQ